VLTPAVWIPITLRRHHACHAILCRVRPSTGNSLSRRLHQRCDDELSGVLLVGATSTKDLKVGDMDFLSFYHSALDYGRPSADWPTAVIFWQGSFLLFAFLVHSAAMARQACVYCCSLYARGPVVLRAMRHWTATHVDFFSTPNLGGV